MRLTSVGATWTKSIISGRLSSSNSPLYRSWSDTRQIYRSLFSYWRSLTSLDKMPQERKLRQTTLTQSKDDRLGSVQRKRTTQLRQTTSDDEQTKRIKKAKPPPKPKTRRRLKKAMPDNFDFKTEDIHVPSPETPKLPRAPVYELEDEMEISDVSEVEATSVSSESTSSEGLISAVSVSIRKEVPNIRKRAPKGSKKDTVKMADVLADLYVNFDPVAESNWPMGHRVPYKRLSDTFQKIEETTKRLEITRLITECFRCILATMPEDLKPAVYLCVNRVSPAHEGLELGIGDSILVKAIAGASGSGDIAKIKKQYEADGDLGSVAMTKKGGQNLLAGFRSLTIIDVFQSFVEIAKDSGEKTQERKRLAIERLLNASKGNETKFITRSLQGKLRIGLAEMTVLQSIGQAFFMTMADLQDKSTLMQRMEKAVEIVKSAYSMCPSYDMLIDCLIKHGLAELETQLTLTPGIPVQPMLAKPTNGIDEVLKKFEDTPFTCEFKYDGERLQIHVKDEKHILIYSRNAEDVTGKYPDVVQRIPELLKSGVESVVLDCEAVAFDLETQKIQAFQKLSTRARKDVTVSNIKVHVCLFCFDCLYMNGTSLLDKPLTQRRDKLYNAVTSKEGYLQFVEHRTSSNVEELQEFLDLAVQGGTEGLIVKTLDCTYEPSKRSVNWLKLKKDYLDGVGDAFDLVVIGAWHGKGKRRGVFGSYLLAVYDPVNDEFQSICKIGTGFSEEDLENYSTELRKLEIPQPPFNYQVGETMTPDAWFDAKLVWEVKAADMSISPVHKAGYGIVDEFKGVSIRFPRLIRVRDDKGPKDATSAEQVAEMYRTQAEAGGHT